MPKIKKILKSENLVLAAYRKVPVEKILGEIAHSCMPNISLFIKPTEKDLIRVFETGLIQAQNILKKYTWMTKNYTFVSCHQKN